MANFLILFFISFLLTIQSTQANINKLQIRNCNGAKLVNSRNNIRIQLSNRAYYAIKNLGLESIKIEINGSKYDKNLKLNTSTSNIYLKKKNLIFSIPNGLLKDKGLHYLSVIVSNQSFDGSFNYAPTFEIANNTPGLEVSVLPQEQPLPENETEDGLIIESITEEPAQTVFSENGLEISF